jgi:uncharacterized membrane protein YbhN (UPF0104 family)
MKLNKNIKIFINYFLGPVLFVWLAWSIYNQINHQPDLEDKWMQIKRSLISTRVLLLAAVLLMMLINWGIEAIKWKISIRKIQQVSFLKAFKATLSGVSFSVSTPNRVGEYLGRMLYMEEGNRLKVISATIISSISQLIITLVMGVVGLIILFPQIKAAELFSSLWIQVLIYGVIAGSILLILFYFRLPGIVRWVQKLPGSKRFAFLITALEDFHAGLLLRLLGLSILRFIVFVIQYYLLFVLFDVDVSRWISFWAINVSFLVLAIIPTITIAELAQRGAIVTTIMKIFTVNALGVNLATICIWFINLIIPAIAGSLLILGIRKIVGKKQTV